MEDEDQTRKSPIPVSPIWPGNGEGIPDSRLRRNRESGNPPVPDSAGTGDCGPAGRRGFPGLLAALSPCRGAY
jgi:hypothetical protein